MKLFINHDSGRFGMADFKRKSEKAIICL